MFRSGIRIAAACALAALAATAAAQSYPTKPVRIMVGAGAGGGTDIIARMLADKYQAAMGQPFVVENKPGASNTIAADLTAKAPPDGHTLLVATNTGQAIAPHLMKLGFDSNKDLIPVALIVVVPNVLVVGPAVPANSVRDLIVMMKAKPDAFSYGSSGIGSTQHLAGEAFNLAAGTKAVHVPYKGSSQVLADLVGGQIQLDFDTTSSAMAFIKGGKVKALAVMSPKRSPELPDVPTLAEAGLPGVEMTTWYGLFVTAGTPKDVVNKIFAETMKALQLPDVQKRLLGLGGEPGNISQEQFAAMVRSDYDRFGKLIKDANVKIAQ
ncbi:MAG: tripartite tricarboxylate transporter substrate binding protein [Betaproteobacteria bacterium]|nr:tripartite tricarboxylate transporter substrate binding protein [Betaproteobacteria bacterium]MCC7217242.1 tripartite tricarboxylate transporter substrate binding protein [Burkholderiales bacterium]